MMGPFTNAEGSGPYHSQRPRSPAATLCAACRDFRCAERNHPHLRHVQAGGGIAVACEIRIGDYNVRQFPLLPSPLSPSRLTRYKVGAFAVIERGEPLHFALDQALDKVMLRRRNLVNTRQ